MRHRLLALALLSTALTSVSLAADAAARPLTDQYFLGPDSKPQEGVPKGKVTKHEVLSEIFADTRPDGTRVPAKFTYQVYVPAQYDGTKPAAVFIGQDGNNFIRSINEQNGQPGAWMMTHVLDNLIHKKEIPLVIGIYIDPSQGGGGRANQYDTLSDRYARFVIEEVLPLVSKDYKITSDPEGRVVGGFSSGAICAFTMAWERPDQFRKVASFFGSYTSIAYRPARDGQPMRPGGDLYPGFIRKTPVKPLTIFIQDGTNDLNNEHGSWYLANQQMVSAIEFANANADRRNLPGARYKLKYEFGDGAHTANHGASILPDVLRYLLGGYEPK